MKTIISILTIIFLFISLPLWAVDLKNATLKQLVTERPDLVQDIKSGRDEGSTVVSIVKDAKGRMKTWTEKRKDLDGVVTSKRVDTYSYYLTGEINKIIQEKYKGKKLISKKKIKHYRDGGQPNMEKIAINEEIPKK